MHNPYEYITAEIVEVTEETQAIKTFRLKPGSGIGFRAGQFMELTIPGVGEAPFTPSSNHDQKETLDFTIMAAGRVTKLLHQMNKGETVLRNEEIC